MGGYNMKGIAAMAVIAIICVTAAVIGIVSDKYLGPDNIVESEMETIIKDETGVAIDLSPEKNNSK